MNLPAAAAEVKADEKHLKEPVPTGTGIYKQAKPVTASRSWSAPISTGSSF